MCHSDVTAALFVDAAGVMAAADALSSFACAAPEEDDFGVVQHSLPTLVCSLAACLLAVEDYVASPAFTGSFAPPPKLEGNAVVRPQPAAVTFGKPLLCEGLCVQRPCRHVADTVCVCVCVSV